MRNFVRLAEGLQVEPLLEQLAKHPHLWNLDTERSKYPGSAHREAQQILVRWAGERTIEAAFRDLDAVDCEGGEPLIEQLNPLYFALGKAIGETGDFGRVMITRLPPGGAIARHLDEGLYADHYDRFHICLQADPGSTFICGGEAQVMLPGEAWWFNHKREHQVVNEGRLERIHLIVDVQAPAYRSRRGITYQAELVADLWPEFDPLLKRHWSEIAHYADIPLEVDRETYEGMERAGALRCYTARAAGNLIGYVVFFVRRNIHYSSSLQALQDVLFLDPHYRRGMAGATLIRVAETRLRAEGVQVIYHHVKRTNRVGELLVRLGYELVDEVYAKRLDKKG